MTVRQQIGFWLVMVIAFGLIVFLLRDMLLPFVVGMAVAYLADPLADKLEDWGLSRAAATTVITLIFFVVVIVAVLLIVPLVTGQVIGLIERAPGYLELASSTVMPLIQDLIGRLPADLETSGLDMGQAAIKQYTKSLFDWLGALATGLWSGGLVVLNLVSLLVITPIVSFYLLWEWDNIVAKVDGWLPRRHAGRIRGLIREIDAVLSGFVRGQVAVCSVLGLFYGIALSLVGLEFGFVIGVASGMLSFIPFVGAIFGAVASIGVALVQFWPDFAWIGAVAGIYAVGQVLEGYFLTPRLVGGRVGLHPVWIMFALLAGGVLFGFVGIILAVPAAAVVGVLVRFLLGEYLASTFYDEPKPQTEPADDSSSDADADPPPDGVPGP